MKTFLFLGICVSSIHAMEVPLTLSSPVSAQKSDIREIFNKYGNARIAHELLVSNLALVHNTLQNVNGALREKQLRNWATEYSALNGALNSIYKRITLSNDVWQQQVFFRYAVKWASLRHIQLLLDSYTFKTEYLLDALNLLHMSADSLKETFGNIGSRDEDVPAALTALSRLEERYKQCSSWLLRFIVTYRLLVKELAPVTDEKKRHALALKIVRLAHLTPSLSSSNLKSSLDTTHQA